jgi:hypothetical protein
MRALLIFTIEFWMLIITLTNQTSTPTKGACMSLYFLRIRNGRYCGASNEFEVADRNAAWTEMTKVCGDLVGSIARQLTQDAEWEMELLDESKKAVFKIRLVAETFV